MHTNNTDAMTPGIEDVMDTPTMTGERFKSIVTTIFTDDFVELCFSSDGSDDRDDYDKELILCLLAQCEELSSWRERGFSHRLVLFHSLDVAGATTDYLSMWMVDLLDLSNSYDVCTDEDRRSTHRGLPKIAFHERVMRVLAKNLDGDVLQQLYHQELQHSILHSKLSSKDQPDGRSPENIHDFQTAILEPPDTSSNTSRLAGGDVDDNRDADINSYLWMCLYLSVASVLVYNIYFG